MIYTYKHAYVMAPFTCIYGFAYKRQNNRDNDGKTYFQKPVLGAVTTDNSEAKCKQDASYPYHTYNCRYFVPIKVRALHKYKAGDIVDPQDLAWSKAVSADARYFSDNEKESYHCYQSKVLKSMIESLLSIHTDMEQLDPLNQNIESGYHQFLQDLRKVKENHDTKYQIKN